MRSVFGLFKEGFKDVCLEYDNALTKLLCVSIQCGWNSTYFNYVFIAIAKAE